MTKVRAISAAIAIVSVLVIVKFGGYPGIAMSVFFISLVSLHEFGSITLQGDQYKAARIYFVVLGLIAFTFSILHNEIILDSFVLSTLLIFIFFLLLAKDETVPLQELVHKAGLCLFGIFYAGVCPVYICLLAKLSPHLEWFAFTLAVIFSGDTAAYFAGRKWGRSRLFTRISPNKSLEGAIASLFTSVVVGMSVRQLILPETDVLGVLVLSILTSIVAQLGDLCESMIKRSFNTKDSGTIMPGHGGFLDRMDGVLFGAPLVYTYVRYMVL